MRVVWENDVGGRLNYLFVAGVEGCGHHGLNPVLVEALQGSGGVGAVVHNKRRLKRTFNWLWCNPHATSFTRPVARALANGFFARQAGAARAGSLPRWIVEDNSFPAGDNRDLGRQWDLAEMEAIVRPHAEVRFIGLYRDPIACTFSHPELDGGFVPHARLLRRSLELLDLQLAGIDPERLFLLRYEDLIARPPALAEGLARFLQVEAADVVRGFERLRPSRKDWRQQMAPADQEAVRAIFPEGCEAHWPIIGGRSSWLAAGAGQAVVSGAG